MVVSVRLGLGVRVEVVVLRDPVVLTGPHVGDHDVVLHPGGLRGVHRADGRVPVHGVGALRGPSARARGPDHGVLAGQQLREGGHVHVLDVRHHRVRPRVLDVLALLLLADHGVDRVPLCGEQPAQLEPHLAVAADDRDLSHLESLLSEQVLRGTVFAPGPRTAARGTRIFHGSRSTLRARRTGSDQLRLSSSRTRPDQRSAAGPGPAGRPGGAGPGCRRSLPRDRGR